MRETHLAIDARMANDGGIGTYIRGLVPRIVANRPNWRFSLIGGARVVENAASWIDAPNVSWIRCDAPIYSVAEQTQLRRATTAASAFWSPHYIVPVLSSAPLVATVHDVMHLARDEYRAQLSKRLYARAMFGALRRRARAILFDSAFTETEFLRHAGKPAGATRVVHLGIGDEWRLARSSSAPGSPYIVFVGYRKPHKNLRGLLEAFNTLLPAIPHDLYIVGRAEGLRTADDEIGRLAAACGDRVKLTGEISDEAVRDVVAGAQLLVQPSFYEGFGLTPLEAMAAGCPCVVSKAGSLPEVCGDAAVYCDPADPASIADGIRRVAGSDAIRSDLIARGRARVAGFTWQRCAAETLPMIETVL